MGGKGQRRRVKNYLSAHGGDSRLPPPVKSKEVDVIPSKLRKLMQYMNNPSMLDNKNNKGKSENTEVNKKSNPTGTKNLEKKDDPKKELNSEGEVVELDASSKDKKKKKRKRSVAEDLSLQLLDKDAAARASKRKERKKEFIEKKKIKKQKKEKSEEVHEFPGQEKIQFGEVVLGPPKLTLPKLPKSVMDASKERARLDAVEAYRSRRNWTSRLGVKLPTSVQN